MRNSPILGFVCGIIVVLIIVIYSLGVRLNKATEKIEVESKQKLLTEEKLHETKRELIETEFLLEKKDVDLEDKERALEAKQKMIMKLNEELKAATEARKALEQKIAIDLGFNTGDDML